MSIIESVRFTCDRCHHGQVYSVAGKASAITTPRFQAKRDGWRVLSDGDILCPPCRTWEQAHKGCQHEPKCLIWPAGYPLGEVRVCQMTDVHLGNAVRMLHSSTEADKATIDRRTRAMIERVAPLRAMAAELSRRAEARQVQERFAQELRMAVDVASGPWEKFSDRERRRRAASYWNHEDGYGL